MRISRRSRGEGFGLTRYVSVLGSPPSVLPDISPSRGEIDQSRPLSHIERFGKSGEHASRRSPPLRGRCLAGQRGVSHGLDSRRMSSH
ncbi:hypothetical protein AGR8A_Cc60202 [Agrobacterium fabrum str. J-07]|nr:hypothetical protein AGR8A_Cc60202 [Agrobacterium fabrum str. J-07]